MEKDDKKLLDEIAHLPSVAKELLEHGPAVHL